MNVGTMRERQANIRLSEEEAALADQVARHYGLNLANLFRMLVKREHDTLLVSLRTQVAEHAQRIRAGIEAGGTVVSTRKRHGAKKPKGGKP